MAHYHQNNINMSDHTQKLYGKDGEYGGSIKGVTTSQEGYGMPTLFKHYHTNNSTPALGQPMGSKFHPDNSEKQVNYMANTNGMNQIPQVNNHETTILDPIDTNNRTSRNEKLKRKLTVTQPPNAVPMKMKASIPPVVRPLNIRQNSFPVTKSLATRALPNNRLESQNHLLQSFSASHTPDSFNDFFYFPETPVEYSSQSYNQSDDSRMNSTPLDKATKSQSINMDRQPDYNIINRNSSDKKGKLPSSNPNKPMDNMNFPMEGFKGVIPLSSNRKSDKGLSKKPSFHLPLDNLGNQRIPNSEIRNYPQTASENLRILEPDLGIDQQDFNTFNTIITPSMKPPGTNQNGYFENYTGIKSTGLSNSPGGVQGELYSENEIEPYLYNDTTAGLNSGNTINYEGNDVKQDTHTDLSGFNLDLSSDIPSAPEFYVPIQFKPIEANSFQQVSESPEQLKGSDNDKESMMSYLNMPENGDDNETDMNSEISSVSSNTKEKTKKKRIPKGAVCSICDKYISRDLTRHKRIHNEVGRFQCVYPKKMCGHKTQHFNRPYDYKKHLLHMHFKFDDAKGKTANNLTDKLPLTGVCQACGTRYVAGDWLHNHVLTNDLSQKCTYIDNTSIDNI